MIGLRKYLLLLVTAAILTSVLTNLISEKSENRKMIRMICGIFLLLSAILPFKNKNLKEFSFNIDSIKADAAVVVEDGNNQSKEQLSELIKQNTESYIHDKATAMGANIKASVRVTDGDPPMPVAVKLEGSISPYAKSKLVSIIANDIGILEEQQTWT